MKMTRTADSIRIVAQEYQLEVRPNPPRAVLADREGRIWSALSLLADVDCTSAHDETHGDPQPEVSVDGDAVLVSVSGDSVCCGGPRSSPSGAPTTDWN